MERTRRPLFFQIVPTYPDPLLVRPDLPKDIVPIIDKALKKSRMKDIRPGRDGRRHKTPARKDGAPGAAGPKPETSRRGSAPQAQPEKPPRPQPRHTAPEGPNRNRAAPATQRPKPPLPRPPLSQTAQRLQNPAVRMRRKGPTGATTGPEADLNPSAAFAFTKKAGGSENRRARAGNSPAARVRNPGAAASSPAAG